MENNNDTPNKIAVFGIGGAGGRIVNKLAPHQSKIDLYAIDTDVQELNLLQIQTVQIGHNTAKGESAASRAETGKKSALEDKDRLEKIICQYDLIYLVCGMGAGTGTGATPVIANLIKKYQKSCIAILSSPFRFEGKRRNKNAGQGIAEVQKIADICCILDSQNLLALCAEYTLRDSFARIDTITLRALQGFFKLQNQDPKDWNNMHLNNRFVLIGVAHTDTETDIDRTMLSAMKVLPIKNIDFSHIYIHLSGATDHTQQCVDIAEQYLDSDGYIVCHFEQQEAVGYECQIVVISVQHQIQEEKTPPILLIPPSKSMKAVGSDDHGVGGSFPVEDIYPRLCKPLIVKSEVPPKETNPESKDKTKQSH